MPRGSWLVLTACLWTGAPTLCFGASGALPSADGAAEVEAVEAVEHGDETDLGEERSDAVKEAPGMMQSALNMLDYAHDFLSAQLVDFVDSVDLFFGDKRLDEEARGSFLRFGYGLVANTDGSFDEVSRIKLKLDLPRIEKKLNILFASDAEEEYQADGQQQENRVFAGSRADYSTALRYVLTESDKWNVHADAGVVLKDPPQEFVRGRLRRVDVVRGWSFRFTQLVFWHDAKGLGESTQFDIETRTGWNDLLRFSANAIWTNKTQMFNYGQGVSLYHELDPRHALVFNAGMLGETEPSTRTTGYFFGARIRKRASRRNWLFFEIQPRISFNEDRYFKPEPTLTFYLEAIIGSI